MDYFNETVQSEIEDLLQKLEALAIFDASMTESWMREFAKYREKQTKIHNETVSNTDREGLKKQLIVRKL